MLILVALSAIIKFCSCDLDVTDWGILPIHEDDMAIIFYLTLRNMCDRNLEITVAMNQCCDQSKPDENICNMYLIGGYMGTLKRKEIRNVTLINPNLYYYFRRGSCSISVIYRSAKYEKVLTQMVEFQTNNTDEEESLCPSFDTDPMDNCNPVDCVMKYFGEKNYFNPTTKECEWIPTCINDPDRAQNELVGYSWLTNECVNFNNSITKYDLQYLENNQAEYVEDITFMNTAICHHGEEEPYGDCLCSGTWRTSLFEDDVYEPSLLVYHMCNIEPGGWNCVNRNRIEATALIIGILSVTIASKLLILMCILNWCYKHFKKNRKPIICTEEPDDFNKSLIISDVSKASSKCICVDLKKGTRSSVLKETTNITYYPGASAELKITSESTEKVADYSINLSNTTSVTTTISVDGSESESYETTDYEIDFTGDEYCMCPEVNQKPEEPEKSNPVPESEEVIKEREESSQSRKLKFEEEKSSTSVTGD